MLLLQTRALMATDSERKVEQAQIISLPFIIPRMTLKFKRLTMRARAGSAHASSTQDAIRETANLMTQDAQNVTVYHFFFLFLGGEGRDCW